MLIVLINDSLDCALPMVSGTIWTGERAERLRRTDQTLRLEHSTGSLQMAPL